MGSATGKHSMKKTFIDGLTRPGLLAFTVALTTATSILVALSIIVDEEFFSRRGYELFAADGHDDWTHASQRALQVRSGKYSGNGLTLLGSSATREMLSSPEDLEADLQSALGRPVKVHQLATANQMLWESAGLLEMLGKDYSGVVMIGVGLRTLVTPQDNAPEICTKPRLAFRSPILDAKVVEQGGSARVRTGIYLVDNREYFLPRRHRFLRNLFIKPDPIQFHEVADLEKLGQDKAALDELHTEVARRQELLAELYSSYSFEEGLHRLEDGFATLDALRALADAMPNCRLVFLRPPFNPDALQKINEKVTHGRLVELYKIYTEKFADYCALHGVPHLSVNDSSPIDSADFYDHCHLGTRSGRRAATRAIATFTADTLQARKVAVH